MKHLLRASVVAALLAASACSESSEPSASVSPLPTNSTTASTTASLGTEAPATSSTATVAPVDVSTLSFSIGVGGSGVTYDLDGSPPSGPTSFAVLDDGSVVIADTMAADRGEPRLLHFDRTGEPLAVLDLADEEVAAIVDVVTDGSQLAILDVLVKSNRYRVLTLSVDGDVAAVVDIPQGFWFEDGLTGLTWDDSGILLEFELGTRHARLADGAPESPVAPLLDGNSIELIPGSGRTTYLVTSRTSFAIERATDLGSVTVIGIAPDGSIVVVVDEVDLSGEAIAVTRRVRRYSATGEFMTQSVVDAADQFLDIQRPLELDATGQVLYLQAGSDRVTISAIER
jgi:hypothetical protein